MSYSFYFAAATKDDAKRGVAEKMASVVEQQPNHKVDQEAAVNAANAFIDVLADPAEGEEVSVSMSGSVGWRTANDAPIYTGASVQVGASIRAKPAAA